MLEVVELIVNNEEEKERVIKELSLAVEELADDVDALPPLFYKNASVLHMNGTLCDDAIFDILKNMKTAKIMSTRSKTGSVIVCRVQGE